MNHTLTRDCEATVIPAGNVVTLRAGTEVSIIQSLGGNVTVQTDQGLVRIAAEDTSAMGGYARKPRPRSLRASLANRRCGRR